MSQIHQSPSDLAGKTVKIKEDARHPQVNIQGQNFQVEDWWDRVAGQSWKDCEGNPAAIVYGIRAGQNKLPMDDEVVYGKIGAFGHLIHVSEIEQS